MAIWFYVFLQQGSPTKIDHKNKDTLILTSLLEDLDFKRTFRPCYLLGGCNPRPRENSHGFDVESGSAPPLDWVPRMPQEAAEKSGSRGAPGFPKNRRVRVEKRNIVTCFSPLKDNLCIFPKPQPPLPFV